MHAWICCTGTECSNTTEYSGYGGLDGATLCTQLGYAYYCIGGGMAGDESQLVTCKCGN